MNDTNGTNGTSHATHGTHGTGSKSSLSANLSQLRQLSVTSEGSEGSHRFQDLSNTNNKDTLLAITKRFAEFEAALNKRTGVTPTLTSKHISDGIKNKNGSSNSNSTTSPNGTPTKSAGSGGTLCETDGNIDCSGCSTGYTISTTAALGLQTCIADPCTATEVANSYYKTHSLLRTGRCNGSYMSISVRYRYM